MGVSCVMYAVSDDLAEKVRNDPPYIWLIFGEPEAYLSAKTPDRSFLDRLLRRPNQPAPPLPADIPDLSEDEWCDIDKSWHAVHFLLTGDGEPTTSPLGLLVADHPQLCSLDVGYGPPIYCSPSRVREFSEAIRDIDRAELEGRFDPAALEANDVYPSGAWSDASDWPEYLGEHYEALRDWVQKVSEQSKGIILTYT